MKKYLKELVICHRCKKLHKKRELLLKEEARCISCNSLLYKNIYDLEYKLLSYTITAMVFFLISMIYPILEIDMSGFEGSLNIIDSALQLYEDGYVLISVFVIFVLVLMPLVSLISLMILAILFIFKVEKNFAKSILKLLEYLKVWNMVDIFFVSILVALVKIFDYALIEFDVAFFSIIIYIGMDIYLFRHVYIETLWDLWERKFG